MSMDVRFTILPTIYGLKINLPIICQLFYQLFMSMLIILPRIHYCLMAYFTNNSLFLIVYQLFYQLYVWLMISHWFMNGFYEC